MCKQFNIRCSASALCICYQWLFRASYISSPQNTWMDTLSRGQLILSEWVISQASFLQLLRLQNLQVDLFARPGNVHLSMFGRPFHHPQAAVHDALTADWNSETTCFIHQLSSPCAFENFTNSFAAAILGLPPYQPLPGGQSSSQGASWSSSYYRSISCSEECSLMHKRAKSLTFCAFKF